MKGINVRIEVESTDRAEASRAIAALTASVGANVKMIEEMCEISNGYAATLSMESLYSNHEEEQ